MMRKDRDINATRQLSNGFAAQDVPACVAAQADRNWLADPTFGPELKAIRHLGAGGFGKVHLVERRCSGEQYAVKQALISPDRDYEKYRMLLMELQQWADLDEHPNLLGFRFFWTLDDGVAIFSEYAPGGSLADWIDDDRLYCGGDEEVLLRIVDIGVQIAWALHVLHRQGVVHRDVKPANILLTEDAMVKLADFGLAQLHRDIDKTARLGAMGTETFWSPAQAKGKPPHMSMDLWSWALTMTALFAGKCDWPSGTPGVKIIDDHEERDWRVSPPPALLKILRSCLGDATMAAPPNAKRLVEMLQAAVKTEFEVDYERPLHEVVATSPSTRDLLRMTPEGGTWEDPTDWETQRPASSHPGHSRRAMILADLIKYEDRLQKLSPLAEADESILSHIHIEQDAALVQSAAGDIPGALRRLRQQIKWIDRRRHRKDSDLLSATAEAYKQEAILLLRLGETRAAGQACKQALKLFRRVVHKHGRTDLAQDMTKTQVNLGNVLLATGKTRLALENHREASHRWEMFCQSDNSLRPFHSMSLMNYGVSLCAVGDHAASLDCFGQSLQSLREWGASQSLIRPWRGLQARILFNMAGANLDLGHTNDALAAYGKTAILLEELVDEGDGGEWGKLLAMSRANQAELLQAKGRKVLAASHFAKAIDGLNRLIHEQGHWELSDLLARMQTSERYLFGLTRELSSDGSLTASPLLLGPAPMAWRPTDRLAVACEAEIREAMHLVSGRDNPDLDKPRQMLRKVIGRIARPLAEQPKRTDLRSLQFEACTYMADMSCDAEDWDAVCQFSKRALELAVEPLLFSDDRRRYLVTIAHATRARGLANWAVSSMPEPSASPLHKLKTPFSDLELLAEKPYRSHIDRQRAMIVLGLQESIDPLARAIMGAKLLAARQHPGTQNLVKVFEKWQTDINKMLADIEQAERSKKDSWNRDRYEGGDQAMLANSR